MRLPILLSTILLILASSVASKAHNTSDSGLVVLYADPIHKTQIMLDGKLFLPKATPIYLPIGTHVATAWCTNYQMASDTFEVKSSGLTTVILRMEKLPAFFQNQEERRLCNLFLIPTPIIFGSLAGGRIILGLNNLKPIKMKIDYHESEMLRYKSIYDNAVTAQTMASAQTSYFEQYSLYKESIEKYNIERNKTIKQTSVFIITGASVFTLIQILKPKRFIDKRAPFTAFYAYPTGNSICIGFHFN